MSPKLVFKYFDVPARGEPARLLFLLGNVPFEDVRVGFGEWPELKAQTPFGQLPILDVDGTIIAQSGAIDRYAAKLGGLYPTDPLEAAKTEMATAQMIEIQDDLFATSSIKDLDEKVKARQELLAGKVGDKLRALDALVAAAGGEYVLGSKLSWADIELYCTLSMLQSGMLDGVPKDVTHSYPALKKLRNAVASIPAVAERYRDATEAQRTFAYKADA